MGSWMWTHTLIDRDPGAGTIEFKVHMNDCWAFTKHEWDNYKRPKYILRRDGVWELWGIELDADRVELVKRTDEDE